PLAQTAARFVAAHPEPGGTDKPQSLLAAIADYLRRELSVTVRTADFREETLPVHLVMNFQVVDEHGRFLAMSRQLPQLKAELGAKAQSSFQAAFARIAGSVTPASGGAEPGAGQAGVVAGDGRSRFSASQAPGGPVRASRGATGRRATTWDFGELPELLELESPDGEVIVG